MSQSLASAVASTSGASSAAPDPTTAPVTLRPRVAATSARMPSTPACTASAAPSGTSYMPGTTATVRAVAVPIAAAAGRAGTTTSVRPSTATASSTAATETGSSTAQ